MSDSADAIAAAERRKAILALRRSGETLEAIGQKMQISRSRVGQLIAAERRRLIAAPPPAPASLTEDTPVAELPISLRVRNILAWCGYKRLGDIHGLERNELLPTFLSAPNGARRAWNELEAYLDSVELDAS